MKLRKYAVTALFLLSPLVLRALDGRDVMRMVEDRDRGTSTRASVRMDLVDRKGAAGVREIEMFGVEDAGGLKKIVVVFNAPASVRNTRYLAAENAGRDDDKWIFLPALKRVRRIAASEGGSSFMGSDFTYDDLSGRDIDEDEHLLLREEKEAGEDCYVVESRPRVPGKSQYGRRISWIDKTRLIPLKIELYDKADRLLKIAGIGKIEKIQGYWTPTRTTMRNVQTGTSTTLTIGEFVWNETLPAGIFTQRYLETGRP